MTTGSCLCGAFTYRIKGEGPPSVYCCHCRNCQTLSGSAFSQYALVHGDQIEQTGEATTYSETLTNGATAVHHSCRVCQTGLWIIHSAGQGLAAVRVGTFDASDAISPIAHIWVSRKQPWVTIADDLPTWPEDPEPAAFIALLTGASSGAS